MKRWMMLCFVGLMGCPSTDPDSEVQLQMVTGAPPTLTAALIQDEPTVRLSAGVAMAVRCWDTCPKMHETCEGARIEVDNGDIVDAREVYSASIYESPSFVLAGKQRGGATVTISTRCGKKSYRAIVE